MGSLHFVAKIALVRAAVSGRRCRAGQAGRQLQGPGWVSGVGWGRVTFAPSLRAAHEQSPLLEALVKVHDGRLGLVSM